LVNFKELDLDSNYIEGLKGLEHLNNLEILLLRNNKIKNIDEKIKQKLKKLKKIDLTSQRL